MKIFIATICAALACVFAATAAAGPPPAYLCNRSTLGVVTSTGDGHLYKCSVKIKFVGPYAYTTYYWLDIGFPV